MRIVGIEQNMPAEQRKGVNMKILKEIISDLEKGVKVSAIRKGSLWTGVVSRRCGLSSALNGRNCGKYGHENFADKYSDMSADKLASLSLSDDIAEASLGMAAINSVIDIDIESCEEFNSKDFIIKSGKGKNVSVVGHFPFVDELRNVTKNLWVIEKKPKPGDFQEGDSKTYLPESDIIAITSTTFINHTLSNLLKLCPDESVKILLGPTTPLTKILFDYGIDVISGSYVTDTDLVLENIKKGMSFSAMKKCGGIKLVNLVRCQTKIFPTSD